MAGAVEVPPSMAELPVQGRGRLAADDPRWYCLDIPTDSEAVSVISLDGNDILVRLFDAARQRELSGAIATTEHPAQFAPHPGRYAMSLWTAGRDAEYEIRRNAAVQDGADIFEKTATAEPEWHPRPAIAQRPVELMRAAGGVVGGAHAALENSYGLTVPNGYHARVTSKFTGARITIAARNDRDHLVAFDRGAAKLAAGRYLLRVTGTAAAETSYTIRVDMLLARLDPDRTSARPLREGDRHEVIVGGDRPRAEWLEFVVSGESRVTLTASRYGAPAALTLTTGDGTFIARMRLATASGEMTETLGRGHYFVRIESDDGAAANVRMRVSRFDPEATFGKNRPKDRKPPK